MMFLTVKLAISFILIANTYFDIKLIELAYYEIFIVEGSEISSK